MIPTPPHSYMRMLYNTRRRNFHIAGWWEENAKRGRHEPRSRLLDKGRLQGEPVLDVSWNTRKPMSKMS